MRAPRTCGSGNFVVETAASVGKGLADAGKAFIDAVGTVVEAVVDAAGNLIDFASDLVQAVVKIVKDAVDAIDAAVNALMDLFFDMFGFKEMFELPDETCDIPIPIPSMIPKRRGRRAAAGLRNVHADGSNPPPSLYHAHTVSSFANLLSRPIHVAAS